MEALVTLLAVGVLIATLAYPWTHVRDVYSRRTQRGSHIRRVTDLREPEIIWLPGHDALTRARLAYLLNAHRLGRLVTPGPAPLVRANVPF